MYGGSAGASHWQVLEEQTPVGSSGWATAATYIYGNEIDEAIHVWKAPGTAGGGSAGADYYLHHDDLSSATCATNAYGTVIERYRYGDYGAVTVRNADGSVRGDGSASNSVFANTRLFTGREYDVETGLYHFRNRYLDPSLARFISRDPIGVWGDEANLGNPLAYLGGRPWTVGDPYGLMPPESVMDRRIDSSTHLARDTGLGPPAAAALVGAAGVAASMIPFVGEAMDAAVLADPESSDLDRSMVGFGMGLDESSGGFAPNASAFIFAARVMKKAKCPKSGGIEPVRKGRAGEELAGIDLTKPKESIRSAMDPDAKRIPDEINRTSKVIKESKNVKHLNWTRQLEDYARIAEREGFAFQIHMPSSTTFSRSVLKQIETGRVTIVPYK